MNEPTPLVKTPGVALTGIAAVIYGLGVAFLDLGPTGDQWWLMVGAAVVGVLFLVFLVVPFVRRMMGT